VTNINFFENILKQSKNSKKILLIDKKNNYGDFFSKTMFYFNFLKANVKQGQVLCVCLNYSLDYIAIIFASYLNKNILTFINPSASSGEKDYILKNSRTVAIFHDTNEFKSKNKIKLYNDVIFSKVYSSIKNYLKPSDRFIIYTSGTSSLPKGVILTDKSIASNCIAISKNLKLGTSDRSLIFSPPSYAMAMSQVLSLMYSKSCFSFNTNGMRFPNDLIKVIKKHKLTVLNLSVSAFRIMEKYLTGKVFKSVRLVMSGGMPLPKKVVKSYYNIFPKAKVINFYGCTENSPRVCHFEAKRKDINNYTIFPVGKALNGIKVKIIKKTKKDKSGIICISGKSLMRGYYRNNQLNREKLVNSWFNTGDIGFIDKERNLNLLGREDNTFRVGHEKLNPSEIEIVMSKLFNFKEVAISKIKSDILDWEPVAVIKKEKKNILSGDKIISKLRKYLSNYKIPKKYFFINHFPKTHYGKLDRKKLEKLAERLNESR
tara:strand:+ start:728 stop:2188 length:1461 start_codon:yes stop_codon:yes gene_type:complete